MKKFLPLLLVVVMIASLTACARVTPTPEAPAAPVQEEPAAPVQEEPAELTGTVTVWAWDPNFNVPIMQEAANRYNVVNPNVEIEIVDIAKGDLEQRLHVNLASGVADGLPDITLIEDYNAQMYLQGYPGAFADLTGKINHADFVDYKVALMSMDGKVYGVPFDSGVSGFFYRSDLLEQAGFTAEDLNNITWERFIEIGKAVQEATGVAMLAFDANDGGLMRVMMQSSGQWYFDEQGNPSLVGNAALTEAIETYKEILDSGITIPTAGWTEWVGAFNAGNTASVVTGVWIMGSVKAEATQSGLWSVAPTPRLNVSGSVNASNLGGSSWYVLESSDNKDAAIDFLNKTFAADIDFYQQILVERGAVGSFIPALGGEAYTKADPFFADQKVFEDFSKWMQEIPPINFGTHTYAADAAIFASIHEFYNGAITIVELLERAQEQLIGQIGR